MTHHTLPHHPPHRDTPARDTPQQGIVQEMRLFSPTGARLYLTKAERHAYLRAVQDESPARALFCQLLHDTGCRPSEARETSAQRVLWSEGLIVFRTLKKRRHDRRGREKLPEYRAVPVSWPLLERLDRVFGIRRLQKDPNTLHTPLWTMSRSTAYRLVKRVMARAGIHGDQATGKGLRHAYGVAMMTAARPVPIHLLAKAMGHSSTKTTEVYLRATGDEERNLFLAAWDE
jgi:integrase/recombinase XerD